MASAPPPTSNDPYRELYPDRWALKYSSIAQWTKARAYDDIKSGGDGWKAYDLSKPYTKEPLLELEEDDPLEKDLKELLDKNPNATPACWVSSYQLCSRAKVFILSDLGFTKDFLKTKPTIEFSSWIRVRTDCGGRYSSTLAIKGTNPITNTIEEKDSTITRQSPDISTAWTRIKHSFTAKDYQNFDLEKLIVVEHSQDNKNWQGYYGTRILAPTLKFLPPS